MNKPADVNSALVPDEYLLLSELSAGQDVFMSNEETLDKEPLWIVVIDVCFPSM